MIGIEVHWHLHRCICAYSLPQIVPHRNTCNQLFYSYSVLEGRWKCMFHHLELCKVFLSSVEYMTELYYWHLKLVLGLLQLDTKLILLVCMVGQIWETELLDSFGSQCQM